MNFTFQKEERLKSRKLIEQLYKEGTFIKVFPLRMLYLQTTHTSTFPAQAGVSVPKRNFKRAVDRNRLKRLLRESYRKQKHTVYDVAEKPYVFMISYLGKEMWSLAKIEPKMTKLLMLFASKINELDEEKEQK